MLPVRSLVHAALVLTWLPLASARAHDADAAARGARVYERACQTCHGLSGNGEGPAARQLSPRPRDFTRGIYKFRSTPSGRAPTTADLVRTIRAGVPRTTMPAWESLLTERQIRDVARYLTTFAPAKFAREAAPITIPEPTATTPAAIAEGKSLYIMLSCWTCHGTRGRGDGKAAGGLTDDWGHEIVPFDFTSGRFKSGDTDRDVYRSITTGLDGTPMPAYGDAVLIGGPSARMIERYREVYSDAAIDALRAYLDTQPGNDALRTMSAEERRVLAERRVWSVVHYVRSLRRESGILHDLFVEDHEVSR